MNKSLDDVIHDLNYDRLKDFKKVLDDTIPRLKFKDVQVFPIDDRFVPKGRYFVFKDDGIVYMNYEDWYKFVFGTLGINKDSLDIIFNYAKRKLNINRIAMDIENRIEFKKYMLDELKSYVKYEPFR